MQSNNINKEQYTEEALNLEDNIKQWKKIYEQVLTVEIHGQHFVYRPLSRFEFRRISELEIDDGDKEEIICSVATLFPESYDFVNDVPAAIPTQLTNLILEASGLSSPEETLNILTFYRDQMLDIDSQIDCIIKEAFPEFDLEDIPHWTIKQAYFYFSRAEWILANLRGSRIDINKNQIPQVPIPEHIKQHPTSELNNEIQEEKEIAETSTKEYPEEYYNLPPEFREQDSSNMDHFPEADLLFDDF